MKTTFATAALVAMAGVAGAACAHGPAGHEESVDVLQHQSLPGSPGKQAVMLKVGYGPGQKSAGHMHPGPVFAYVLEGEVESQLQGEPPVVYKAGQSWYEAPGAHHLVSRNASTTKPATLLVWMVKGEQEAPVLPLPGDGQ